MRVTSPDRETSPANRAAPPVSDGISPPVRLPLVTLNDLLWLLYLYPIRWLARVLPRWSLYAIGKLSDPIVQFHARRRKARAAPWIAMACRTTPVDANRIAGRSLSNGIFRTLDELLLLGPSSDKLLRCEGIDGIQHLQRASARGKGVILLVGHFCANRIALRYLAAQGYPVLAVHNQRPSNLAGGRLGKVLQPRSMQLQQLAYADQAYIQDPGCSLKIMRRLRAGGLAVLQVDGRGGTKLIEQVFLGVPWLVASGIYEIVRLSDCAVVPMLSLGRSAGFRIRFDPMLAIHAAPSRETFLSANLPGFLGVVEKQIVENPEEWRLWNHF
jgi:lauroyl/myristoyl acyltransferase